jgi:hypothetical protein
MTFLRALRLPHWIAIGAVLAVVAAGAPSKWFGLVSTQVSDVERLRSCMEKHGAELTSLVTTLGEPQELLAKTPAQRRHAIRVAEHRHELKRRQGAAIEACARTIAP